MNKIYIKARSNRPGKVPKCWRDSVKTYRLGKPVDYSADLTSWYYLKSVPSWLDWAIPWGGLRIGHYLYVAGDVARAFNAGYFHVETWRKHG